MDPVPPIPLSIAESKTWQYHTDRIRAEGRIKHIDLTLLAVFCQTLDVYRDCLEQIKSYGVLVQGRTERELVRSPALTPLNQARDALVKLSRAIPLTNPKPDTEGEEIDSFLEELMGERVAEE